MVVSEFTRPGIDGFSAHWSGFRIGRFRSRSESLLGGRGPPTERQSACHLFRWGFPQLRVPRRLGKELGRGPGGRESEHRTKTHPTRRTYVLDRDARNLLLIVAK
jgi:hypothetical protein